MRSTRLLFAAIVLALACGTANAWWTTVPNGLPNEVMIDDFEDGILHETADSSQFPDGFGWERYAAGTNCPWQIDATQGANGSSKSLKITVPTQYPYFYYRCTNLQSQTAIKDRTILAGYEKPVNRMRFFIKAPQNWLRSYWTLLPSDSYIRDNFNVGTYQKDPSAYIASDQTESYNWHFYYYIMFNMYDAAWVPVVVNKAPTVQRPESAYHVFPGFNATRPIADLFSQWTLAYFASGTPRTGDVQYPYEIWFDQWSFYYEKDHVTMNPEYGAKVAVKGTTVSYPIVIRNTHPSESREFGLYTGSGGGGPTGSQYTTGDPHLYVDINANGVRDAGENTEQTTTGTLAPGQKWYGVLQVTIPSSGTNSGVGDYFWTNVMAWQKTPTYAGIDPHMGVKRWNNAGVPSNADPASDPEGIPRGVPVVGADFTTTVVASLPAADTTAPAAVTDLGLVAIGKNDAKLRWTNTGDDGTSGKCYAYDVRYSTSNITEANWASAVEFTGDPDPWPAGQPCTFYLPPEFDAGITYYVALKATDEAGNVSALSNVVSFTTCTANPSNVAPTAIASANVTTGPTPLSVNLSSAGSTDSDGTIALRVWDFGDGTFSNAASPTHTFDIVGTNTVKLTVFDNNGSSHSTQTTISPTRGPSGRILLRKGRDGYVSGTANGALAGFPTMNWLGGTSNFKIGNYAGMIRGLFQFANLPASLAIPGGSHITDARLLIYHEANCITGNPPSVTLELHNLAQTFVPTEATWNNAASGTPWGTPGAIASVGSPFAVINADYHAHMLQSWNVTSLVSTGQSALNVALRIPQETGGGFIFFGTHDYADQTQRPALLITYESGGANNPPVAQDGSAQTNRNTPVDITLIATDPDQNPLTYSIVAGPSHGALGAINGNVVTYTPTTGYSGPDSFTFKANDGLVDSNVATVSITVNIPNAAPVAQNGSPRTAMDTPVDVTLVATDADSDPLTYSIVAGPSHGSLGALSGNTVTYTPASGYTGTDTFTFKANDGKVDSNIATITVTITEAGLPSIVFQNGNSPTGGYAGCNETWMWEAWPNDAWGDAAWGSSIGTYSCVGRSLLKFDVSGIGPGTSITSAKLRLNMCVADTSSIRVYQVLKPWAMASTTWNSASAGNAWTTPGCGGVGTDRAATPCTTFAVSASDLNKWVDVTLPVSLVQGWVDGTIVNAGVLFMANPESTWNVRYCNDNWPDLTRSPMLEVMYTWAGDVNGDGHVDVVDLLYLVDAFGSVPGDTNWDPACDFNSDASVDVVDLLMLVENFGK